MILLSFLPSHFPTLSIHERGVKAFGSTPNYTNVYKYYFLMSQALEYFSTHFPSGFIYGGSTYVKNCCHFSCSV